MSEEDNVSEQDIRAAATEAWQETVASAPEVAPPKRRPGRRPKAVRVDAENGQAVLHDVRRRGAVRWDAPAAPIDGDYEPLKLVNTDPEFEYFWANATDLGRLQYRGWKAEEWSPACARPAFYFGDEKRGEPVRYKDLTLMKLPKVLAERFRESDPARRRHKALMAELLKARPNATFTVTEQTLQMGVG